jgi:hypothetical protein
VRVGIVAGAEGQHQRDRSLRARERAVEEASELMLRFAERTGLASDRPTQRYLWTDAFAVCNFIALARATGEQRYVELALQLVEQVHRVLGRHRSDDPRTGWISGLAEREGERHPTRGGLRIGKRLPERPRGAPFDESLEWDRDGQYFHYLTRWMHALDQLARAQRQPLFNTWARELAETAHRCFTVGSAGDRRMVWKMGTDLSRPLVPSMGQHDPLDGWITCLELEATAAALSGAAREPSLDAAIADFAIVAQRGSIATADPLGLGGLLIGAAHVAQLVQFGESRARGLLEPLLAAALAGLAYYERAGEANRPASERLAFRELGLAIGISALEWIERAVRATDAEARAIAQVEALARYVPFGAEIQSLWRAPGPRGTDPWREHRDINEVMLATCLVPEGVIELHAVS